MSDFPSVLAKADLSMVRHEPFPHIIVDDALPTVLPVAPSPAPSSETAPAPATPPPDTGGLADGAPSLFVRHSERVAP